MAYPFQKFRIAIVTIAVLIGCCAASCKNTSSDTAGNPEAKPAEREDAKAGDAGGEFPAGAQAPAFELVDGAGTKRSLADFKGKVVLLNFWATWCAPCVAEMGSLERLYKTFKGKDFEVVGVNVDAPQNAPGVQKFLSENGITFANLRDPELSLPEMYRLEGFPESFFIGKDGKFLEFLDPASSSKRVRIVGDRAWDSENTVKAVKALLEPGA